MATAASVFSVWTGWSYRLFSDDTVALKFADKVISDFVKQNHPISDTLTPEQLVSARPPKYWLTPAHVRDDGEFIGALEAPPCEAGDKSASVAAAVAAWHEARDAAWNNA